jgi:ABC-2 type transport system ATP-binding protein
VAAALVHRPPVLFLDEPTTGLDPSGRSDLWALTEQLVADGTTLLLTTQYLEEADRLADNIIVIDDGRIIAHGTPAELKAGLGNTIIEVRLPDAVTAQRASAGFRAIGPSEVADDGRTVEIHVAEGGRCILEVARVLDANSLVPDSVSIREPTLDDVFLQLTGRRAELSPADAEAESGARSRSREEGAA